MQQNVAMTSSYDFSSTSEMQYRCMSIFIMSSIVALMI